MHALTPCNLYIYRKFNTSYEEVQAVLGREIPSKRLSKILGNLSLWGRTETNAWHRIPMTSACPWRRASSSKRLGNQQERR